MISLYFGVLQMIPENTIDLISDSISNSEFIETDKLKKIDLLNSEAYALRDADVSTAEAKNEAAFLLLEDTPQYQKGMAEALNVKGCLDFRKAKFKEALESLFKVEQICNQQGIVDLLPNIYRTIAGCYSQLSYSTLASQYLYKHLFISEELNFLVGIAGAKHNIGVALLDIHNYDDAIAMFDEVLVLTANMEDKWIEILTNINLSKCYIAIGEFAKAKTTLKYCQIFAEENSHDFATIYVNETYFILYDKIGDYEQALKFIDKSLGIPDLYQSEVVTLLRNKVMTLMNLKRHSEVEVLLAKIEGYETNSETNSETTSETTSETNVQNDYQDIDLADLLITRKLRIRFFTEQGQFERASKEFQSYIDLNEEHDRAVKTKNIKDSEQMRDLELLRKEAKEAKHHNLALEVSVRELKELQKKYYEQSILDPLTGIPNRRYITNFLTTNYAAAKRYKFSLGVAIMDLDYFKSVNDDYSHQVGDDVLKTVGELLQSHCRESDAIARFGGEEFILTFKEDSIEDSVAFCERVRKSIEDYDWEAIAKGLKITASFGIASLATVPHSKRFEDLISHADTKLYESKDKGRNCISY